MFRIFISILLAFTGTTYASEIYRCTIDGVVTYSQIPCNDGAVKVEVKNRSGNNNTVEPITVSNSSTAPNKHIENTNVFLINQEIQRNILSIARYERKMTKELRILKARTYNASNNLAGAIYHRALTEEMTVVTTKYGSLIEGLKEKNIKLTAKRDSY